jgi:hypothetical protein
MQELGVTILVVLDSPHPLHRPMFGDQTGVGDFVGVVDCTQGRDFVGVVD